jgi:autotransporter-associated beta strand protein
MQKFNSKRCARLGAILSAAAWVGLAGVAAPADTLYWDPGNTGSTSGGGSGTWDTSTQEWFDQDLDSEVYWDNSGWTNGPDNAVFDNSPGTVTLAAPIVAATITFNSSGYVLGGGSLALSAGTATTFSTAGGPGTETITTSAGTANINVGSGVTATINSPFSGGSNVLTLGGGGTLVLGGQSSYSGATSILAGTLQIGATNALPTSTNVYLGTNQGPGVTLNLSGFDQTINNLTAISGATSGGATDTVVISAGNTLNITDSGGSPMFFGAGSTSVVSGLATNVYFVGPAGYGSGGGGNLTINASYNGGNPVYGANLGIAFDVGNRSDSATVDLRDLASFTASLGTMEIGDYNTAQTGTDVSTLYLAPISNITVSTLRIGSESAGAAGASITESLFLGNTYNQINAVDIRVGVDNGGTSPPTGTTNARVNGLLEFNGGTDANPSSGSIVIRNFAGQASSGANLWMINAAPATSNSLTSTVDFTGHHADIILQQLIMALRFYGSTSGSNATATFSFAPPSGDTGSQLQILGNAILGDRGNYSATGTASGTGNVSATLNIGGNPSTNINIGPVTMAINNSVSTRTGTSTGAINFSGGTGTIASLSMANNTLTNASDTSNGTLNITGGSLTFGGDITRAGSGGIENTTLILNGGLLDMNGHNIGGANGIGSGTGSLNFQAGTLQNVLEINAGANGLVKTGANTLILAGSMGNAYSGGTAVNAGTLLANSANTTNGSTGSGSVNVYSGAILAGIGDVVGLNAQVTINAGAGAPGGTISAGNGAAFSNSTGLLITIGGNGSSVFSQVWEGGGASGGNYAWKVNAASPTNSTATQSAGVGTTDPSGPGVNWDTLSMASLDVAASSGSQFNLQIVPTGTSASSFNASQSYTWTIADVTSGRVTVNGIVYNGNSASTLANLQSALQASLALNASALPAPSSNFSIHTAPDQISGDVIQINYSPAPEPGGLALLGLGAAAIMARRRRSR